MVRWVITIALFVALVVGAFVLVDREQMRTVAPAVGSQYVFPENYELVTATTYSNRAFVIYICRDLDTGAYVRCEPTIIESTP